MNLKVFILNNHYHYYNNFIVNYVKFYEAENYLKDKEKEYTTKIYFSRKNDIKNIIENIPTSSVTFSNELLYFKNNTIKL